jgi:hypothetical protein
MTVTQSDKAKKFRALHQAPDAFVIANVWDGGSARMMAGLGFPALATSSGASAGLLGRRDGRVTRDEALAQARVICEATDLPVSADLEKGFGDAPEIVAETIGLGGGGPRRLFDRGRKRQPGRTDLRTRPGDRADRRRRRGGAGAAVPIHADRADGKLPARSRRP